MRTIKFRGKSKIYGCWRFGDLFRTNLDGGVSIQFFEEVDGWMTEDVNEKTVGQFTGEIDSKGREIYENDIVCVADLEHKKVGVIRYNLAHWDIDFGGGEARLLSFINRNGATMEVIGNIHDNPELLKGGAQ